MSLCHEFVSRDLDLAKCVCGGGGMGIDMVQVLVYCPASAVRGGTTREKDMA